MIKLCPLLELEKLRELTDCRSIAPACGNGMTIFKELDRKQNLTLVKSKLFECGIRVLNYEPS